MANEDCHFQKQGLCGGFQEGWGISFCPHCTGRGSGNGKCLVALHHQEHAELQVSLRWLGLHGATNEASILYPKSSSSKGAETNPWKPFLKMVLFCCLCLSTFFPCICYFLIKVCLTKYLQTTVSLNTIWMYRGEGESLYSLEVCWNELAKDRVVEEKFIQI